MTMDLDETRPTPRRLFQIRSSVGELRWSPDGNHLAFSSDRDGRSILGVFDLGENRLEWITNTADRDRYPRWSPDGSRLAFIRFPAGHQGFAVCTVEVGTKQTREIITAIYDVLKGRTHISERMLKKMKSIGVLGADYGCNSGMNGIHNS